MGIFKHHAIVVTSDREDQLAGAHAAALEIFRTQFDEAQPVLVSDIVPGVINGFGSFLIAPDGSKEGWIASDHGDEARKRLINWISMHCDYVDFVEVSFGGDNRKAKIEDDSSNE